MFSSYINSLLTDRSLSVLSYTIRRKDSKNRQINDKKPKIVSHLHKKPYKKYKKNKYPDRKTFLAGKKLQIHLFLLPLRMFWQRM